MNVYLGTSSPSTRTKDGWENIMNHTAGAKKAGKKLRANADIIDPEEEGQDDASLDYEPDEE